MDLRTAFSSPSCSHTEWSALRRPEFWRSSIFSTSSSTVRFGSGDGFSRSSLTLVFVVGTTIAAIVALLVCSGEERVSTPDAFTLFENNSGWKNGMSTLSSLGIRWLNSSQTDGLSYLPSPRRCGLLPAVSICTALSPNLRLTLSIQTTLPPISRRRLQELPVQHPSPSW